MPAKPRPTPQDHLPPKRAARARQEPPAPIQPAMLDQSTPTTAPSAWRSVRRDGFVVPLPSGNVARIKRTFSMINMLENGTIPNPLASVIQDAVKDASRNDDQGAVDISKLDQSTEEGQLALAQFLEMMMRSMSDIFVEPRVMQLPLGEDPGTWTPEDEGCISVVDLDANDQMYAFSFAQGGAVSMSNFRPEQVAAVQSAQDGGDVQV